MTPFGAKELNEQDTKYKVMIFGVCFVLYLIKLSAGK